MTNQNGGGAMAACLCLGSEGYGEEGRADRQLGGSGKEGQSGQEGRAYRQLGGGRQAGRQVSG